MELTLHQEFGRAGLRECRLHIGTNDVAALASLRCLSNAVPSVTTSNRRYLTTPERTQLQRLVDDSDLRSGGHVGVDSTASDGVFETLTFTATGGTVVLVTSGNPAFTTGPRHELLAWLNALRTELRQGLKRQ
jgi:hypothetical protein